MNFRNNDEIYKIPRILVILVLDHSLTLTLELRKNVFFFVNYLNIFQSNKSFALEQLFCVTLFTTQFS